MFKLINVTRYIQPQQQSLLRLLSRSSSRSLSSGSGESNRAIKPIRILPSTYKTEYEKLLENKKIEEDNICKSEISKIIKDMQKIIEESRQGTHVKPFDTILFNYSGATNRCYTFYNKKLYFGGLKLKLTNNTLTGMNTFYSPLTYSLFQLAKYNIDIMNLHIIDALNLKNIFYAIDNNEYQPIKVGNFLSKYYDNPFEIYVMFGVPLDNLNRLMDLDYDLGYDLGYDLDYDLDKN